MQRKAVHGGHIEHMDAGHQRRDAPQTNAPQGERVKLSAMPHSSYYRLILKVGTRREELR